MNKSHRLGWAAVIAAVVLTLLPTRDGVAQREFKRLPDAPSVPMMVFARAGADLVANVKDGEKDKRGEKVVGNPKQFEQFYVYEVDGDAVLDMADTTKKGWFLVGDRDGKIAGWISAEQSVIWKHRMVMSFAEKGDPNSDDRREKVLMFRDAATLHGLASAATDAREEKLKAIYGKLNDGKVPEDVNLVALEPEMKVDFNKEFYLVPVIEHLQVMMDGEDVNLLKIACATEADGESTKDTTKLDTEEVGKLTVDEQDVDAAILKKLAVDIVFVIDTTASMKPFIQATLETVRNIAAVITKDDLAERVRFGAWGFKDSVGSDYVTKNFTPKLLDVSAFTEVLAGVTDGGGGDLPEDVYAGVADALNKTEWTGGESKEVPSLRFLVVIGDAPAKTGSETKSGQSATTLNTLARERNSNILAAHIINPKMKNHDRAEIRNMVSLTARQFQELSATEGLQEASSAYFKVESPEDFGNAARAIANALVKTVSSATTGSLVKPAVAVEEKPDEKRADVRKVTEAIARTAAMRWIGSAAGAAAPADVLAWVADRDLRTPAIRSVEARVLLNRDELSTLQENLKNIVDAIRTGKITNKGFHEAVREKTGRGIMEASLIDLMRLLPYKSDVLLTTEEKWSAMSGPEQSEFLQTLVTKIAAYQQIAESADMWTPIGDKKYHALLLALLP